MIRPPHNRLRLISSARRTRAFTLLEMTMCVLIISVISSLSLINVGNTDAATRLDRAAQQVITAFRYARIQSMGHGQTSGSSYQPTDAYGVAIDTSANTVTVYHTTWNSSTGKWNLPGTTVADGMRSGGTYVVNLKTDTTCAGVVISSVSLSGTSDTSPNTSSPYYCQYRPFGATENPGTLNAAITLTCGGNARTISVPIVGDPQEN